MKKFLKTFLIISILAIGIFTLTGCSKNNSDDTKETTNSSSSKTSVNKNKTETEIKADSLEELEEMVNKDVEDTISNLTKDYENIKSEIDTYNKYKSNTEKVEAFYSKVFTSQKELTIRLREYALTYAEMILVLDCDNNDKYDKMEELYDVIYNEAGDDIYDEIYNGILDDMYDVFYNGILDDAYDTVEYSEWSDSRSDEYDWWSDARSDVYDDWSDFRSDVYDFWSDTRSELWDNDIEKATEEVKEFKEDIEKLKDK